MKKIRGMTVFTSIVCVVLVSLLVLSCVYLTIGPDFVPPTTTNKGAVDENSPIWDCTMDDLVEYLDEKGFLDKNEYDLMSEVGTENRIYNGIDMIWWDVDNLAEGTYPYQSWKEVTEEGYILYAGSIYSPIINGPFGININPDFPGDVDALQKAFEEFTGE